MKFRALALAIVMVALATSTPILEAQTRFSSTTFGAAMSATTDVATVASTTGMTAGGPATGAPITTASGATFLFADLEQMRVVEVISATRVRVQRGIAGITTAHASGATIYFGPGSAFKTTDPPVGVSQGCTPSSDWLYDLWINVTNGNISVCQYRVAASTIREWWTTNIRQVTYDSEPQRPPG